MTSVSIVFVRIPRKVSVEGVKVALAQLWCGVSVVLVQC
jgi:hypothetical protein